MISQWLKSLKPNQKLLAKCDDALLSASLSPRYHKAHQQMVSRFLNAYVRYMFDSVNLAREIEHLRSESSEQLYSTLSAIIRSEHAELRSQGEAGYETMQQKLQDYIRECCEEAITQAKRKSHQFSQLSQSVLKDQRNNLLLSKIILMAQRSEQGKLLDELSMLQLSITPADAFASKLLQDSDDLTNQDNIDVLCYASLAEGIRSVANSQMNHFFQMRRFEKEHSQREFDAISSDEIIDQLELDVSLVLKYDELIALEQTTASKHGINELYLSGTGPEHWH